jgi:hypothetical protein
MHVQFVMHDPMTQQDTPQQLYNHLMSKSHSKADLADYLQMDEMADNPTSEMIAHDIKYNML